MYKKYIGVISRIMKLTAKDSADVNVDSYVLFHIMLSLISEQLLELTVMWNMKRPCLNKIAINNCT